MLDVKDVENDGGILSKTYCEISDASETDVIHAPWKEGLVAGNGKTGVLCSCSPYKETFIFQNIELLMPTDEPRMTPSAVGGQLEEARQAVLHLDDSWNVHGRKRTYLYSYHPGMQLDVQMVTSGIQNYHRWMDPKTGEICVRYENSSGVWSRRTFVLRKEDCVVTEFCAEKPVLSMALTIEDPAAMPKYGKKKHGIGPEVHMRQLRYCSKDGECMGLAVHYPPFVGSELEKSGYAVVTKILQDEGQREEQQTNGTPSVVIKGARQVVLLTKVLAQTKMGDYDNFPGIECCNVLEAAEKELESIAQKYTAKENRRWLYETALRQQVQFYEDSLTGTEWSLSGKREKEKSNEELLREQKEKTGILNPLAERIYQTGRAVLAACAGYSAPRLCGLWTGEWNPGWSGAYTMDANVNLQVSGMNTGNMPLAGQGYMYFILRQLRDWEENAAAVYQMKDALLAPVNTDGNRAVMVEYDINYPFQYWNAGAAWLVIPIFEYWQCYGNQQIPLPDDLYRQYGKRSLDLEQEILWPILKKTLNFWCQLLSAEYYTDAQGKMQFERGKDHLQKGEHYLIIPSYSPENHPLGYTSAIAANAAMDIAAASDTIRMIRELAELSKGSGICEKGLKKANELEEFLPEYEFDETGALKEWALTEMKDNHEHRHISHLYPAWPGVETQGNDQLKKACIQAVKNRNAGNEGKDDTASHGWIHRALVAARLKDGETVGEIVSLLYHSDIFYSSLLTDHNTDRREGVYCTDMILGLLGVINESLVYSERGKVELLPALPVEWKRGCVKNIMARTRACIRALRWDLVEGILEVSLESLEKQSIQVTCPALGICQEYDLQKGEVRELKWK